MKRAASCCLQAPKPSSLLSRSPMPLYDAPYAIPRTHSNLDPRELTVQADGPLDLRFDQSKGILGLNSWVPFLG